MNLKLKALFPLLVLVAASGCRDKNNDPFPYVPVNIALYTTDPMFINLEIYGFETITGGSRGIFVYKRAPEDYVAFDMHCPYQVDDGCIVSIDSVAFDLLDSCCDSRYSMFDGTVTQSPATRGLQHYNTTFDGTVLRITN